MPVEINEIKITAFISDQEVKKHDPQGLEYVDIDALIAKAVETVMERMKELNED